MLSLGEQQRVAFLRLLLHAPKLAFLDEATGALDSATEAALYTALQRHCSSYVSVGALTYHAGAGVEESLHRLLGNLHSQPETGNDTFKRSCSSLAAGTRVSRPMRHSLLEP